MKKFILATLFICFATTTTATAFDMESIQIHGFLSQGYLKSDTNDALFADTSSNGTFEFNEFGLNVVSQVNDDLRVGIQLLSRDMGDIGNNEVEIDWAYGDYNYRNWLGLRAGKMKTPYGLYNQSRDIDAARTCILLPSSVYSEGFRESISTTIGIGAYGELPGNVAYQMVYGTTQLKEDEGVAKLMAGLMRIPEFTGSSVDWAYAGDLKWSTPIDGLTLGTSTLGYKASLSSDTPINLDLDFEAESYIASIEFIYGNLTLASEYQLLTLDYSISAFRISDEQEIEGYYFLASYRINDWLEVGTYYNVQYLDKDDRDGDNYKKKGEPAAKAWKKDFALTSRFDINDNMVFKLEGHLMDGLATVEYDTKDPDDTWYLLAAKVTFSF
jgi:hypothetical protein